MVSYYERISERFKGGIKVEPASLAVTDKNGSKMEDLEKKD